MANELYDKLLRDLFRLRDQQQGYADAKAKLWEAVSANPEKHLDMFFHNWFNHNWTREEPRSTATPGPLRTPEQSAPGPAGPRKPYTPQPPKPTVEELRDKRKHMSNMLGLALLNSFLPDGETRLKDATGAQVRRAGGLFAKIAKFVKPGEVVGRKLTAEQVSNLWGQTTPPERKKRAA